VHPLCIILFASIFIVIKFSPKKTTINPGQEVNGGSVGHDEMTLKNALSGAF